MAAVTTIVLPHAQLISDANAAIAAFEAFERRFARQARISVALTGISGIYMLWRLACLGPFRIAFILVATSDGGAVDSVCADAFRI